MKILKASAGSGKTYALSHRYLDSVLDSDDRYAYRHILAVTFTNKATADMKAKILAELYKESETNPKARRILVDILHDYSAFAVSTIERFFQQALKAFSNEIGHFASYQVELDRDSLLQEAADRLLDSISEDSDELKSWIRSSMKNSLNNGKRFKIDTALAETCNLIRSGKFRRMKEAEGFDESTAFSKDRLADLHKTCRGIITAFPKAVREAAEQAMVLTGNGNVKKGLRKYLKKSAYGDEIEFPSATLCKSEDCGALVSIFENGYEDYNTACIIDKIIYSLGLCGELSKSYGELLEEKNVLTLDDSSDILKGIIDNTDAPFIYEKLGVRYGEFLLDEFQDTSEVQWGNFLPLLLESESGGGSNLIVGDVKQSIYRFRDSEWKLLGEKVFKAFPSADVETLESNWRSLEEIVDFNNRFFSFVAQETGLEDIYNGLEQKVKSVDPQGRKGLVEVRFTGSARDKDAQIEAVVECIESAVSKGASYGDIVILTRDGGSGALIADELIRRGIDVTSDDSLLITNSVSVCRLLAILRCIDNPENNISRFMVEKMQIDPPHASHSLVDLCDKLLGQLQDRNGDDFEGEIVFIEAFMDIVREWCENNGNQISAFLSFWDEKPKRYIGAPEGKNAVRIMTIHKSKGLEFKYVIIPFAEKIEFAGKSESMWAHLDCKEGPFKDFCGLYPVTTSKKLGHSHFNADYSEEMKQRTVDGVNIAYVAFTRATKEMHIISASPAKSKKGAISNIGELLHNFCGNADATVLGEAFVFGGSGKDETGMHTIKSVYTVSDKARTVRPSADALDFFGADGSNGTAASARIKGIVLHKILESVQRPEDLDKSVRAAVNDGLLDSKQGEEALRLLSARIAARPSWFDGGRNEASIIDIKGNEHRPDRVIIGEHSTTVIDYKFGEEDKKHIRQVSLYVELYRLMGYENVSGFVWYVPEDKIISV